MSDDDYLKAKRYVVRILARKNYASFELRKKLCEYPVSEELSERLIGEFIEAGYVDDRAWIKGFIRQESARKHGSGVVLQKLRQKNVPEELMDYALSLVDQQDAGGQIRKLLQSRYRSRDLSDYHQREKTIGALMRRGYQLEEIKEAISEATDTSNSADDFLFE